MASAATSLNSYLTTLYSPTRILRIQSLQRIAKTLKNLSNPSLVYSHELFALLLTVCVCKRSDSTSTSANINISLIVSLAEDAVETVRHCLHQNVIDPERTWRSLMRCIEELPSNQLSFVPATTVELITHLSYIVFVRKNAASTVIEYQQLNADSSGASLFLVSLLSRLPAHASHLLSFAGDLLSFDDSLEAKLEYISPVADNDRLYLRYQHLHQLLSVFLTSSCYIYLRSDAFKMLTEFCIYIQQDKSEIVLEESEIESTSLDNSNDVDIDLTCRSIFKLLLHSLNHSPYSLGNSRMPQNNSSLRSTTSKSKNPSITVVPLNNSYDTTNHFPLENDNLLQTQIDSIFSASSVLIDNCRTIFQLLSLSIFANDQEEVLHVIFDIAYKRMFCTDLELHTSRSITYEVLYTIEHHCSFKYVHIYLSYITWLFCLAANDLGIDATVELLTLLRSAIRTLRKNFGNIEADVVSTICTSLALLHAPVLAVTVLAAQAPQAAQIAEHLYSNIRKLYMALKLNKEIAKCTDDSIRTDKGIGILQYGVPSRFQVIHYQLSLCWAQNYPPHSLSIWINDWQIRLKQIVSSNSHENEHKENMVYQQSAFSVNELRSVLCALFVHEDENLRKISISQLQMFAKTHPLQAFSSFPLLLHCLADTELTAALHIAILSSFQEICSHHSLVPLVMQTIAPLLSSPTLYPTVIILFTRLWTDHPRLWQNLLSALFNPPTISVNAESVNEECRVARVECLRIIAAFDPSRLSDFLPILLQSMNESSILVISRVLETLTELVSTRGLEPQMAFGYLEKRIHINWNAVVSDRNQPVSSIGPALAYLTFIQKLLEESAIIIANEKVNPQLAAPKPSEIRKEFGLISWQLKLVDDIWSYYKYSSRSEVRSKCLSILSLCVSWQGTRKYMMNGFFSINRKKDIVAGFLEETDSSVLAAYGSLFQVILPCEFSQRRFNAYSENSNSIQREGLNDQEKNISDAIQSAIDIDEQTRLYTLLKSTPKNHPRIRSVCALSMLLTYNSAIMTGDPTSLSDYEFRIKESFNQLEDAISAVIPDHWSELWIWEDSWFNFIRQMYDIIRNYHIELYKLKTKQGSGPTTLTKHRPTIATRGLQSLELPTDSNTLPAAIIFQIEEQAFKYLELNSPFYKPLSTSSSVSNALLCKSALLRIIPSNLRASRLSELADQAISILKQSQSLATSSSVPELLICAALLTLTNITKLSCENYHQEMAFKLPFNILTRLLHSLENRQQQFKYIGASGMVQMLSARVLPTFFSQTKMENFATDAFSPITAMEGNQSLLSICQFLYQLAIQTLQQFPMLSVIVTNESHGKTAIPIVESITVVHPHGNSKTIIPESVYAFTFLGALLGIQDCIPSLLNIGQVRLIRQLCQVVESVLELFTQLNGPASILAEASSLFLSYTIPMLRTNEIIAVEQSSHFNALLMKQFELHPQSYLSAVAVGHFQSCLSKPSAIGTYLSDCFSRATNLTLESSEHDIYALLMCCVSMLGADILVPPGKLNDAYGATAISLEIKQRLLEYFRQMITRADSTNLVYHMIYLALLIVRIPLPKVVSQTLGDGPSSQSSSSRLEDLQDTLAIDLLEYVNKNASKSWLSPESGMLPYATAILSLSNVVHLMKLNFRQFIELFNSLQTSNTCLPELSFAVLELLSCHCSRNPDSLIIPFFQNLFSPSRFLALSFPLQRKLLLDAHIIMPVIYSAKAVQSNLFGFLSGIFGTESPLPELQLLSLQLIQKLLIDATIPYAFRAAIVEIIPSLTSILPEVMDSFGVLGLDDKLIVAHDDTHLTSFPPNVVLDEYCSMIAQVAKLTDVPVASLLSEFTLPSISQLRVLPKIQLNAALRPACRFVYLRLALCQLQQLPPTTIGETWNWLLHSLGFAYTSDFNIVPLIHALLHFCGNLPLTMKIQLTLDILATLTSIPLSETHQIVSCMYLLSQCFSIWIGYSSLFDPTKSSSAHMLSSSVAQLAIPTIGLNGTAVMSSWSVTNIEIALNHLQQLHASWQIQCNSVSTTARISSSSSPSTSSSPSDPTLHFPTCLTSSSPFPHLSSCLLHWILQLQSLPSCQSTLLHHPIWNDIRRI